MLSRIHCNLVLFLSMLFFISCSTNDQKKISNASSLVKNFTIFTFPELKENDTILKCYLKAISFKDDSVIIISTDENYKYTYDKTRIPGKDVKFIDSCLACISIDSLIGSDIIRESRKHTFQYCGYHYGFENPDGKIGVFIPVFFSDEERICLEKLRGYIFSLSGVATNDTIDLMKPISRIQEEALRANPIPKIEHIEFKPPAIDDEPVDEK